MQPRVLFYGLASVCVLVAFPLLLWGGWLLFFAFAPWSARELLMALLVLTAGYGVAWAAIAFLRAGRAESNT